MNESKILFIQNNKYINTNDTRAYFLANYNQTLSFDLIKSNKAVFTVYYSNLDYTLLTESPKTSIGDLFSQIGGALGMFVSFSVFTLFELIEILILVIYNLLSKNKKTKVIQVKTQK